MHATPIGDLQLAICMDAPRRWPGHAEMDISARHTARIEQQQPIISEEGGLICCSPTGR